MAGKSICGSFGWRPQTTISRDRWPGCRPRNWRAPNVSTSPGIARLSSWDGPRCAGCWRVILGPTPRTSVSYMDRRASPRSPQRSRMLLVSSPSGLLTKSTRWGGPPDRSRRPRRPLVLVCCQSRTRGRSDRGASADEGVRPTATYIAPCDSMRLIRATWPLSPSPPAVRSASISNSIARSTNSENIARRFFSPEETAELLELPSAEKTEAFFHCWTRKEAYIKAMGGGLSIPLDSFRVTLRPGVPARMVSLDGSEDAAHGWTLHSFDPAPVCWRHSLS